MTRPRNAPTRELFGILGVHPDASAVQRAWNAYFRREGKDAFMGRYPAVPEQLPERLSEMFHFDRRMYIVGSRLQGAIIPLLDHVDSRAEKEGKVDTVVNRGGEFFGFFLGTCSPERLCGFLCGVGMQAVLR